MAAKKPTLKATAHRKKARTRSAPRTRANPDTAAPVGDLEIIEVHRRFIEVMEGDRLLTVSTEMRGHYLTVMRSLTAKLSVPGKPLSEILSEVMTEAAPLIFRVMQH
jgi:hypothetical protein